MTVPDPDPKQPRWTFAALRLGAMTMMPLLPGLMAFGMAFGTVAARKGFSLLDTLVMTGTVFAGMAQMIAVESWPDKLTTAAIVSTVAVTGLISLRFVLIGATLRPWLHSEPSLKVYPTLYLLTEPNWLLSMRYRANGGDDPAYLLGSGLVVYVSWVASALPGYWLGAAVANPRSFGLDLIMPAFFIAMLVSLWRGPRRAIGWMVGAAVAIAADQLLGGFWYLIAGALAGSVVGGLVNND